MKERLRTKSLDRGRALRHNHVAAHRRHATATLRRVLHPANADSNSVRISGRNREAEYLSRTECQDA